MTPEQLEEIEARARADCWPWEKSAKQKTLDALALTAALRQAWEENKRLREAVKELERPTMYWPDGECPSQPPEDFLESEYQMRGEDEWEEEFGNEGVMCFMCAHSLPHAWVAYRRHPDGFVTSEHKTEEEARAALKEPTHDQD
jgi:hypothetical protein